MQETNATHLDKQPDKERLHIRPDEGGVQVGTHVHLQLYAALIAALIQGVLPMTFILLQQALPHLRAITPSLWPQIPGRGSRHP
jgi:hypothetical protein